MAIDAEQFEACYRRLEQPLYNVLYRWFWDPQTCQDLMHDGFAELWRRRDALDGTRFDALVYTTVLNLARNRLRWQRLRRWIGLEFLDENPDEPDDAIVASHQLQQALQVLCGVDRNLLLLSEFAGLTTLELADVLGIAPGTVGSRKHRALARLRKGMELA